MPESESLCTVCSAREKTPKECARNCGLRPVLSLKARIISVKDVFAEESAGYGLQLPDGRAMEDCSPCRRLWGMVCRAAFPAAQGEVLGSGKREHLWWAGSVWIKHSST